MTVSQPNVAGLTSAEAKRLQDLYGKNELSPQKKETFFQKAFHILCEPMFLLLIAAAIIYFILGEPRDGAIMLIFVAGIISIDVIQEWKTDQTLHALKDLSAPQITVIRDGNEQRIASADLVPGDLMMICEGVKIPADGVVLRCADLCVDESSLTGEAEGVWKTPSGSTEPTTDYWRKDYCYAGTLVTQGTAVVQVDQIGAQTEYGKIGLGVAAAPQADTPLQKQTGKLVKTCAILAGVLFALVAVFTWFNIPDHPFSDRLIESVLSGVTLAMAMIPEEFPVILTVFLSMGAWRLAKKNSLVRKLPSVETLGAVSVLCVDKTGTITQNQMTVQEIWVADGTEQVLVETMGLGCETDAYDPMEKAMLRCCEAHGISKESLFSNEFVREYPFTIAAAHPENEAAIPAAITDCRLTLLGLVGLADPPRESVKNDIAVCNRAGIRVVMITGDNGITASAIAQKIGVPGSDNIITGEALEAMSDEELRVAVKTASIFSRVIPAHKMRIVKAFQENGAIVAMTGDVVNDAPALKYADIGIAMGKRGSEVSREAADLILLDDNFTTIVETVRDGRRIYDNIRKAVGYVFTIHIPIAAASLLAPFLGIAPAALLLLPLHVVLLEVLIDPTCSIVLERQPAEEDIMARTPRDPKEKLLTGKLLAKSVLQGFFIFAASFGAYFASLAGNPDNAPAARAMGLAIIMLANLFLVQVNSSDHDFAYRSVRRLSKDPVMWAINLGTLTLLAVILYTPVSLYLKLAPLTGAQLFAAIGLATASVLWYEFVKLATKLRKR